MVERDIIPLVADLVKDAENYRDTLSADRIKAIEYYDGIMKDTPSDKGRSGVVKRDVMEQVQKVLPALSRVFLASDQIVEYPPANIGDEESAQQATDYINNVVFPECNGPRVLTDSIHDALKQRNSVLTWVYEERIEVSASEHNGLDDVSWATLVNSEGVEVVAHSERQETIDAPEGPMPATVHDLRIKRRTVKRAPKIECIPLEEFLIHPDALDEDTALVIGRKTRLRRSDLVAMGYEKEKVDLLPITGSDSHTEDSEELTRRNHIESGRNEIPHELQEIDYYNLLVRIDKDGDGLAELRHMCFGGEISSSTMLHDEGADDVNFAIVAAKTKPHQWEGVSVFDDIGDVQRINTVLLRSTLDNLYWQNNLQMGAKRNSIENPDALTNPQFGQTIWINENSSVTDALMPVAVPFIAKESFAMLQFLDDMKADRTGINDASGGMPPDALQNVTAKAMALMESSGIGQTELMARTLAMGFRRMFKGLLRLIIKHQDKPRTVRLRDKWVTFDPRQWNADMDCSVNVGLGAGTRERDMAMLMNIFGLQEKIMQGMGPDNPFVTPENFGNTLVKIAEAAGLKSPNLYFTKPDPQELAAKQQAAANQPNPEIMKMEAELNLQRELKELDIQQQTELKRLDVEAAKQKEIVQSQAAVEEKIEVSRIEAGERDKDRALKKYEIDQKIALERDKMRIDSAAVLAPHGLDLDEENKPYNKANRQLESLIMGLTDRFEAMTAASAKPRRVVTPDGEQFVMETFDVQAMN